jgi:hypothetical protein
MKPTPPLARERHQQHMEMSVSVPRPIRPHLSGGEPRGRRRRRRQVLPPRSPRQRGRSCDRCAVAAWRPFYREPTDARSRRRRRRSEQPSGDSGGGTTGTDRPDADPAPGGRPRNHDGLRAGPPAGRRRPTARRLRGKCKGSRNPVGRPAGRPRDPRRSARRPAGSLLRTSRPADRPTRPNGIRKDVRGRPMPRPLEHGSLVGGPVGDRRRRGSAARRPTSHRIGEGPFRRGPTGFYGVGVAGAGVVGSSSTSGALPPEKLRKKRAT